MAMKRIKTKDRAKIAERRFWMKGACGCFLFFLLLFFFLSNADEAAKGVSDALRICAAQLIPALLPSMVLCGFFVQSELGAFAAKRLEKAMRLLFSLPGESAAALLFGVIGGYPVGAAALLSLHESGRLSKKEAARLQTILFCPSPAFVIGAVGVGLFQSARFGRILLLSLLLSMLLMLQGLRLFPLETPVFRLETAAKPTVSQAEAFFGAVENASRQLVVICGFICFFGALRGLLCTLELPAHLELFFRCILEVTDGCAAAKGTLPLPLFAALLAFGGLCGQCQILPALHALKVRLPLFFAVRVLHALLSSGFCALLLRFFPVQTAAMVHTNAALQPAAPASVAVSLCLLAMCVMLLLGNRTFSRRSRLQLRVQYGIIPQGGERNATKTAE